MARMFWAKTANGKAIPVDADASPDGNIRVDPRTEPMGASVLSGAALETARAAGEKLHKTHFVTCPQRREWRRPT